MLLRAPTPAELEAAFVAIAARDEADLGLVDFTLEDLREQWADADFDLARDARVAVDPGHGAGEPARVLAYAHVDHHGAAVSIPPEHEGRGIGPRLLAWIEARERELGRPHHGQPVAAANVHGAAFLAARGYQRVRSYFRMVRPLDAVERPPARLPGGIVLRPIDRDRDAEPVHAVDDAAFRPAADYKPETLEAFRRRHLELHDFDLAASHVACRGEKLVGYLLGRGWDHERAGFVDVLGVHPEEHRRGTGTALLLTAFAVWADAGLREAQLGVSSENPGALRLYERLGMAPRFRIDVWQRDARAATSS